MQKWESGKATPQRSHLDEVRRTELFDAMCGGASARLTHVENGEAQTLIGNWVSFEQQGQMPQIATEPINPPVAKDINSRRRASTTLVHFLANSIRAMSVRCGAET